MPWRILSPINIGFIGHVARYDPLRFPRYRGTETLFNLCFL